MKRVFKILLSILFGITLLAMAGLAVFWIAWFDPFGEQPEIVRDRPSNFAEAGRVFKERVAKTFPPGMPETDLIQQLTAQGFTIDPEYRLATFEKPHFPCRLYWRISWKVEQERLSVVDARFDPACL